MKKILFTAVLVCAVAAMSHAQGILKQEGGENNIELLLAPLGSNPISIGGIKFRHFSTATMAYRADVFIGLNSSTTITQQEDNDLDMEELSDKESTFTINVSPGIESHFEGTDRLSPYVGGVVDIGYTRMKSESERQDGEDVETSTISSPELTLGLRGVFGFDYYFAKNIYIGAELGFGFAFTSQLTEVREDTAADDDVEFERGSSFDLGPTVVGQIRTGILF